MNDSPTCPELLKQINAPSDLNGCSLEQLEVLAEEVRQLIIKTVSKNGGHLAPSLGVIELTLALLKCYDPAKDRVIWDVGHQAYAYKILTGRAENFCTLRTKGGISGFPRPSECPEFDHFGVGHSSTSISAGLGMAMARDLEGGKHGVVSIIGDGSMTAGLAFEGLNQAGGMGLDMVVVLNDNEMSISKNVGALSAFLSRTLSDPRLVKVKKEVELLLKSVPRIGEGLARYARRGEDSLKGFLTPGMLFQSFGFNYLGPINGHDLESLVEVFELIKQLSGPVLVHVLTTKGRGYEPAERNPTYFHGVGCFEPETGKARKFGCVLPAYTDVFGQTLCELAAEDDKVVAITAAMPEGTGLNRFREEFPERFVDVGICEQHAVTFAAGLATQGYKPAVAIYSTFMQRSYDQIVHDVCLQNLPVTLFLDRGGLVGEDGATHHGAFDLSYLRHIPGLVLMAPKDEAELRNMVKTALDHPGPAAVRYPRGVGNGAAIDGSPRALPIGEGELLKDGDQALVIVVGSRVNPALEAAKALEADGMSAAVFNSRFVKPLPAKQILELAGGIDSILVVEENSKLGGFGSAVLELLAENDLLAEKRIHLLGLPDEFVEHGPQKELRKMLGLDQAGIGKAIRELLEGKGK